MEQTLLGNTIPHSIEQEITQSYIDYAMSVIVSRALPDVRDGFKPVLRRILYAMHDMGLSHNAKYKKSASVVGEVLGKYHPHGDSSVYEAMVRMAQPFSMRYPLVDGQGNFGSIDGDGAAAMRYTEARLTRIAEEMLEDIDQDTVDRRPNYDQSREEPIMLPTKFPNHLCNGTMGIAVGMATNMASHNLTEIIDACLLLIENPEATIDDIMEIVKGPDFATGGIIFDPTTIKAVYEKGRGGITCRGKTHIE
ncbi:MAG TPA: DNA gyrase subunit A, partial [Candidatus Absconditabacterales bacterium]|nr:DNA gyrase subunit A [Candidatus Absconditabacterales bacterium]